MRLLSIEVDTEQVTPQEAQEYIHKKKLKIKKVVNGMNKDNIMYIINDPIDEMGDVYEIPLKKGKITHYIQYDDKTGGNTLKKIWSGIKKADHYLSFIPSYAMGTTGIYAVADLIENNGNLDKTIDRTVNAYKTGYELTKKALGKGTEWTLDIDDDDDDIYGGYTQPQMKALQKVYYNQKKKSDNHLTWRQTQGIFHKTDEADDVFDDDYVYRGKMPTGKIKKLFNKYLKIINKKRHQKARTEINITKELGNIIGKIETIPRMKRNATQKKLQDYWNDMDDNELKNFYKENKDQLYENLDKLHNQYNEDYNIYMQIGNFIGKMKQRRINSKYIRDFIKSLSDSYKWVYDDMNIDGLRKIVDLYKETILKNVEIKEDEKEMRQQFKDAENNFIEKYENKTDQKIQQSTQQRYINIGPYMILTNLH